MQPSNAEVRAGAVAKLKRATSLPRIKGGRRPPMPPDDPEKPVELPEANASQEATQDSSPDTNSNSADLPQSPLPPHTSQSTPPTPPASTIAQLHPPSQGNMDGHDPPDEPNNDDPLKGQSFSPPPTPTKRKRRSRSRTRTRSKDFKSKTPPPPEESSPEMKHSFLPTDDDIPAPSTLPSRPSPLPFGTRSPLPFTPPTAPSTPVPFGMGVPTLRDIQQIVGAGLHRSQSARTNAMIKLTGGLDSTLPTLPLSNSISRSNTVTGTTSDSEQRAAARQRMMGRLKNRVGGNGNQTDDLTTSGGEDGPSTPKEKKRRSRGASNTANTSNGNTVVDDRDDRDGSTSTTDTTNPVGASSDILAGLSHRHLTPTPQIPPDILPFIPFLSYQLQQQQLLQSQLPVQPPPSPPPETEEPQPVQQPTPPFNNLQQWTFQLDSPPPPRRKHDDVVIEEDDPSVGSDGPRSPSPLPHTLLRDDDVHTNGPDNRLPHTSDAPSIVSALSGQDVPIIMSADLVRLPYKQDFPISPFTTPIKEQPAREEEEEEEIVVWHEKYVNGDRSNERTNVNVDSNPTVDASTNESLPLPDTSSETQLEQPAVPATTEDDDFPPFAPSRQLASSPQDPQDPRTTSPSPVGRDLYPSAPSPSSAVALSQSTNTRESASSIEPIRVPGSFSNTTGGFKRESYTDIGTDYEDVHTDKETSKEKMGWASKLKKTFVERSGSITGRRSRANSTTKRESAASASGPSKVEVFKYDPSSTAPPSAWGSPSLPYSQLTESSRAQPPGQINVPASSSMHSFVPVSPHRRGQSPIPTASPAELSKYGANDKLAPFPGLFKLDEERRKQQIRTRRMSMSSPNLPGDVATAIASDTTLHTDNEVEVEKRERKLSHQYSDTGLLQKFRNNDSELMSPTTPTTPNTAPLNGISHKSSISGSSWLPMSRNDLRKWYRANKINNTNTSPSPKITTASISSPIIPTDKLELPTSRPGSRQQKLTDIFHHKRNNGSATDFEEMSNPSTTPKSRIKMRLDSTDIAADLSHDSYIGHQSSPSPSSTAVRMRSQQQQVSSTDTYYKRENETNGDSIAPASTSFSRPALSIIPGEPIPSDRSWTPSACQTDSSLSYKPSESPETLVHPPERSSVLLRRLESLLSREPNLQPIWSFLDDPPRKLIMSSSVTQIVDSDTIRERFLFLFNDILVVAKPLEPTVMAMDRSFIVKNIIDLNTVQVIPNRRLSSIGMRHPFVQQFVRDFNDNPDLAIANLLQSTGLEDDQVALGRLLFNTLELDRTRLGAYLAKKTKRVVLRTYIDCFGFAGIRIDQALRAFAITLRFPPDLPEHGLEHVLNMFASRWFDANAKLVSYGKDIAMKLVRILVHLDNQLQKSMRVPHQNGYRDFNAEWETMVRAVDPRGLLPDELIQDMYYSLWNNPIHWAADSGHRDQNITFKRAPPNHLVYRIQSDPITIRIQRPDPHLRIQLLSQDGLVFDPPELNFARSTEAAFRVTGSSLGPKSIIFSLLGLHAPFYQGLPYSKSIVVERSFMRNTFQIGFKDPDGSKRRYMFSTEDAVVCKQYMMNVQPPLYTPLREPEDDLGYGMAEAQRAAKALSLKVLRQALSEKISGHNLILICKQNSLIASVLPSVTSTS